MSECSFVIYAFLLLIVQSSLSYTPAPDVIVIKGNQLQDEHGKRVVLHGVNRSGMEFACLSGKAFFDGPVDDTSIDAIKSWGANIIRIPLNEDCLLQVNIKNKYTGNAYIDALEDFVKRLRKKGFAVILDLQWVASGTKLATGLQPMPDREHSIPFWKVVSSRFKQYRNVLFDLYNEPYPAKTWSSEEAWTCWRDGSPACNVPSLNISYNAAGMQDLLNAVRSSNARNPVMIGGLKWSNSMVEWLKYQPHDPFKQTIASWHSYNFNFCNNTKCWEYNVLPVSKHVPIVTGELGEDDCGGSYITPLMKWLDEQDPPISYLASTWNTWSCKNGPSLITSYAGDPTPYGRVYRDHLRKLNP